MSFRTAATIAARDSPAFLSTYSASLKASNWVPTLPANAISANVKGLEVGSSARGSEKLSPLVTSRLASTSKFWDSKDSNINVVWSDGPQPGFLAHTPSPSPSPSTSQQKLQPSFPSSPLDSVA